MRHRNLFLVLAGLTVLAVEAIVLWPREDRITRENCDHIRKGMSLDEVEAILGPPGDYRTGPTNGGSPFFVKERYRWSGDTAEIEMRLDSSKRADQVSCWPANRVAQDPIANAIWRLTRQWRRWFH
jgi:hypothetical protein